MGHTIVFTLVLLLALTMCQVSAWSAHTKLKHIPDFHVVRKLPVNMVAGSTYEWEVSLVNPKSEEGTLIVLLKITEEKTLINPKEFSVEGTLEAYDNPPRLHHYSTLTFTEKIEGGIEIFQSQMTAQERFNRITLRISSVPNLMPGTYTFTLTVTLQYKD